jgi:hypothetical protein
MMFWWDDDGDLVAEMNELYWTNADKQLRYAPYRVFEDNGNFQGDLEDARGEFFSGYEPANPLEFGKYKCTEYDKDAGSTHTTEFTAAIEREIMPDLSLSVVGSWRRYDNYYWDLDMWLDDGGETVLYIQDYDMYVGGPPIPDQIPQDLLPDGFGWDGNTGEAAGKPWYFRDGEYDNGNHNAAYSTDYAIRVPQPDYWNEFLGFGIILNKRLSKNWMLNASFTYQWQKRHWGERGQMDQSNKWLWMDGLIREVCSLPGCSRPQESIRHHTGSTSPFSSKPGRDGDRMKPLHSQTASTQTTTGEIDHRQSTSGATMSWPCLPSTNWTSALKRCSMCRIQQGSG